MDEDIVTKEVIEFSDVIKIMSDFNHIVNDISRRFMWTVVIAVTCFAITVISLGGFYFLSSYDYLEVDQKTVQTEGLQEVHQNVK